MRRIAFALALMIVSGWAAPAQAQWWGGGWGRPCFGGCRPWRDGGWAGPRRFIVLGDAPGTIWDGPSRLRAAAVPGRRLGSGHVAPRDALASRRSLAPMGRCGPERRHPRPKRSGWPFSDRPGGVRPHRPTRWRRLRGGPRPGRPTRCATSVGLRLALNPPSPCSPRGRCVSRDRGSTPPCRPTCWPRRPCSGALPSRLPGRRRSSRPWSVLQNLRRGPRLPRFAVWPSRLPPRPAFGRSSCVTSPRLGPLRHLIPAPFRCRPLRSRRCPKPSSPLRPMCRWHRSTESLFDHWSGPALGCDVPDGSRGATPRRRCRRAPRRIGRASRHNPRCCGLARRVASEKRPSRASPRGMGRGLFGARSGDALDRGRKARPSLVSCGASEKGGGADPRQRSNGL